VTDYAIGDIINVTYSWLGDPNLDTCWLNMTAVDSADVLIHYINNRSITSAEYEANNTFWYNWDTAGLSPGGPYHINITATDDEGLSRYTGLDGIFWLNNTPPTVGCIYPTNESTGISKRPICHVVCNDTNDDTLDITWQENTTGSWVTMQTNNSVSAGSHHNWTYTNADTGSTTFWFQVWVDDGTVNISEIFEFTTKANNAPGKLLQLTPSMFTTGGYMYNIYKGFRNIYCTELAWIFDSDSGDSLYKYDKSTGALLYSYSPSLPDLFNDFFWVNDSDWYGASIGTPDIPYQNTTIDLNPKLGIWVTDADGDTLTVQFLTNASGTWTSIQTNTSVSASSYVECDNVTGINQYNTTYWIRCNISDGDDITSYTEWFITAPEPDRGTLDIVATYPANDTTNLPMQPTMIFSVGHTHNNLMNFTVYMGNALDDTGYLLNTTTNVRNSTHNVFNHMIYNFSFDYYWRVQLNNGTTWINETFHFTTLGNVSGDTIVGGRDYSWAAGGMIGVAAFAFALIGYERRKKKKNDRRW